MQLSIPVQELAVTMDGPQEYLGQQLKKQGAFYIPMHVPSLKNSKQITHDKRIISSKAVRAYEKHAAWFYKAQRDAFKKHVAEKALPLEVGMHFIRKTKAKYDHHNITQLPADMMVKYKWLADDDVHHMVIFPLKLNGRYTTVSKELAGCIIFPL